MAELIKSIKELSKFRKNNINKKIGITHSCFDLLHAGHQLFLEDCKKNCDILCIGLQTDPTVDRPLTKNKPIQSFEEREIQVKSCRWIDCYFIYTTEVECRTSVIELKPDIRFLGDDYEGKPYTGDDLDTPIYYHKRSGHNFSTTNLRKIIYTKELEKINKEIENTVKIMSFNILADASLFKKKYDNLKKEEFIFWDYRKKLIIDIISKHNPDICLLCEVEYDKIIFFSQFCNNNNYGYIYTSSEPPKSKESLEKYTNYTNIKNPGNLIIFKLDKLRLINNSTPDYINYFNNQSIKYKWSDDKLKSYLEPCVSNIILFEKINNEKRFYFSGLHHAYIKNEEIQSEQINLVLKKITKINNNYNYPVIIAGDFNSKPSSNVYKIMNDNKYNSSYKIINGDENKYTSSNTHTKQKLTLDYIFINEKCKVKSIEPIDANYLENNNIPNETFPSDHMFLIANIII